MVAVEDTVVVEVVVDEVEVEDLHSALETSEPVEVEEVVVVVLLEVVLPPVALDSPETAVEVSVVDLALAALLVAVAVAVALTAPVAASPAGGKLKLHQHPRLVDTIAW